jgi:hypothetical protein
MEVINATRMVVGYTLATEPSGREVIVVVVKGTFDLPGRGEPVRLSPEQVPLVMSDVFFGEPGRSAPRFEADFALRKHRCDVLFNGSAYAPDGRPTTHTRVELGVGSRKKTFNVVGDRVWEVRAAAIGASEPRRFVKMPISYDRAFGGTDDKAEDPSQHAAFARNPSGRGFHRDLRRQFVDGSSLPNTEQEGTPVTWVDGDYAPMSLGPIGRHWEPRYRYAGTYDQNWVDEIFPFLPPDFDDRYYQAAPADQQVPHLGGGEEVTLTNLTPEGRTHFVVPHFDAPIHFFPRRGEREDGSLVLDTIIIEPDEARFTLTWRANRPLRKDVFEVAQVMVGRPSKEWWAQRESLGFPIFLSLMPSEEAAGEAAEDGDQ